MKLVYLDNAATTPVDPRVKGAMLPYLEDHFGNPSSVHSAGQAVRHAVEEARGSVAALIGGRADEIYFTSGGTEADNWALKGTAWAKSDKGNHIITTSVEHHAVIEACHYLSKHGFEITLLPVDRYGMVDPEDVSKAVTPKTILISVMHANNEIGTIQPVAEIGKIARERGVLFHVDAVQTAGHLPVNVNSLNADMLSVSGHKLYGPKGTGALYIRKGTRIDSLLSGGSQERGKRPGTENVPGIVGFGKAADIARTEMAAETERLYLLRDRLSSELLDRIPDSQLNGHPAVRLPNNVNISFSYVEGESLVLNLDFEGICASTGSACSSSSLEPSHVLLACGKIAEEAHGSLRFSLGKFTRDSDIDAVIEALPRIVKKLRAMSPLAPRAAAR
ncbi:cysteine desulfurase NifS [Dehalogenimonas alkenigignens]|uniref:Cysteine desulfurase IscS n=1 Tax=Dehalogenimonas alkenigignens TaxID=1217799 RepID=A0A0W0GI74_9CHLR|nr:cysteine desulfurase NifS [Dehalogenimonas alkenigignens]KTB48267.1 cysteine desulfurase NifS [Dehalogenimonas alkenigignens]PVV84498.1 cysteine desulfurase NifS [Dehalogenimonas alkenigignens]